MPDLTKVLLLCLDAADSHLIEIWSDMGLLPTWQALRRDGLVTRVENPPGLYSGAVWPSFYTGLSPGRHGRYAGRQIVSGTYEARRYAPRHVSREPFWNAIGRAGRRVAIIDVPKAPLTGDSNITQVSNWGPHDDEPAGLLCWPEGLSDEVVSRLGRDPVGTCESYHDAEQEQQLFERLIDRVATKEAMIGHFLQRGGWDLFIGAFSESHCVGHQLWHLHDATHPRHAPEQAAGRDPVLAVYQAIDAALGRLIAMAGSDVAVLVYTSHGMGARYGGTHLLDEVLRQLDDTRGTSLQPLRQSIRWARSALPWRRLLPSRLRAAGRALAGSMTESSYATERRNRTFFQAPTNDNCAGVRINLRGREPNGRVEAGGEYDAVCERLTGDLHGLVNADTGDPAVRAVHRADDVFPGEHRDDLPDLVVQWHRDAPIVRLSSPKFAEVRGEPPGPRTGDHRPDGMLVARGADIRPRHNAMTISVVDIAPTIAAAAGVALEDVDGQPLVELVEPLSAHAFGLPWAVATP